MSKPPQLQPCREPCTIEPCGGVAASGTHMGDVKDTTWMARSGAKGRLGAALVLASVAFVVQPDSISWHTRAVASWDLGTLAYLALAWVLIGRTDAQVTRAHALSEDQSGYVIFLFVVVAACAR